LQTVIERFVPVREVRDGRTAASGVSITFTIFAGLPAGWPFDAAFFRAVEESRKTGVRAP
jgi:hypothetical protein